MIRLLGLSIIISAVLGLVITGTVFVGRSLPSPPQVTALSQNDDRERLWLRFIDLERRLAVRQTVPGEHTRWVDIYSDPAVLYTQTTTETGGTAYGIHWYDPLNGDLDTIYSNTHDTSLDSRLSTGWNFARTPDGGLTFIDPGTGWLYLREADGTLHRLHRYESQSGLRMPLRWSPGGERFLLSDGLTLLIGDADGVTEFTRMEFDSSYVWDATGENVLVSSYYGMEQMRLLDAATGEPDPIVRQITGFRARFTACGHSLLLYNTYDERDRDRYHLLDVESGETWRFDPTEQIELDDLQWVYVLPDCERTLVYAAVDNGKSGFYISDLYGDEMTLLAQFTRLVRLPDGDGIYQYADVDGDITRVYSGAIDAVDFKRQIATLPGLDQLAGWQITDDFVFYLREDGFYVQDPQNTYTDHYGKADETTLMYRYLPPEETP